MVGLQYDHTGDMFEIIRGAFIARLKADLQFAFGGEFFPGLVIPIGAFGDQKVIWRRGFVENLVECGLDARLIEFLHDLWRGDGSSGAVADDHKRGDEPILPNGCWNGFLKIDPIEIPDIFGDFERLNHERQLISRRCLRPNRSW